MSVDPLFLRSPVKIIMDACSYAQAAGGDEGLEDELRRVLRAFQSRGIVSKMYPRWSVSALMAFVSEAMNAGDVEPPVEFMEQLRESAGEMDPLEYFSVVAGLVGLVANERTPLFGELGMSTLEARLTYADLRRFSEELMLGLPGESVGAALLVGIGSRHPNCAFYLGGLAGDARAALTMFPVESELRETLGPVFPWVSSAALEEVISLALDHMRTEHSSVR